MELKNQVFRMQTQCLVWPHEAQIQFFFLLCTDSGCIPPECRGNRNELWHLHNKGSDRINYSCGTSAITFHYCWLSHCTHLPQMQNTDGRHFSELFLLFCLLNTFPVGKNSQSSMASKLSFSHVHYTKLC